jgi:hypothetical protein|tara:strand:- start:989 stop:1108 length:120 start_codon:yes stop_codon:yes gene_type:complete
MKLIEYMFEEIINIWRCLNHDDYKPVLESPVCGKRKTGF